jgi:hypothetical protein
LPAGRTTFPLQPIRLGPPSNANESVRVAGSAGNPAGWPLHGSVAIRTRDSWSTPLSSPLTKWSSHARERVIAYVESAAGNVEGSWPWSPK